MDYYRKEITNLNIKQKHIAKLRSVFLVVKIISFIALVFFTYKVINSFTWITVCPLVVAISLYVHGVIRDNKLKKRFSYFLSLNKVYQNELTYLKGNLSVFDNGAEFINKKHSFSFDLDLFGDGSLFHRINRTVTSKGKKHLAWLIENPSTNNYSEVKKQKDALKELCNNPKFRYPFTAIGAKINNVNEQIPQSLLVLSSSFLYSQSFQIAIYISIIITILSGIIAYLGYFPITIPVLLFTTQLILPFIIVGKINAEAGKAGRLYKNINAYNELLLLIQKQDFHTDLNKQLYNDLFQTSDSIKATKELSGILNSFDQRANAYALVLFNGLFLRDLLLLIRFQKWKKLYAEKLTMWIDTIAHFDALISMAGMMFNHPKFTEAKHDANMESMLEVSDIGHPFIPTIERVCNDYKIEKKHFNIVTGANMAGKSTFLRTIGINYLLALYGMTVCATKFNFRMMNLFSSMRNSDDLNSGVSYFHAELNRITQLLQECNNNNYTLLLLDEILKGTNSEDKLKGSILFLEQVKALPVSGIVSTHDLALSKLANYYPQQFSNYCFEIALAENIRYSYKIDKGVAQNLNASFLLQKILLKTNQINYTYE